MQTILFLTGLFAMVTALFVMINEGIKLFNKLIENKGKTKDDE